MLSINNLSVHYGEKQIIKDFHLSLASGEVHGLVGLNGSGKSTLLRTIYGIKKLTQGQIEFESSHLNKSRIAFLETENFFYSRITGYEYLKLFQQKNQSFKIEEWNKLFELPLHSFIETYSTGMKKKLAFLSVICLDKPFLILDEPFNGIDLDTSQIIKTVIKGLKVKSKTILITSHILETLTAICDTISYLKEGKIQFTISRESFSELEGRIFHDHDIENERIIRQLLG
jgi:ABC-2 type transport system ATP-binding protein